MNYFTGDAILIKFNVSPTTVSTATITIKNPSGTAIVSGASMTDEGMIEGNTKRKFTYKFQSVIPTHPEGRYSVVCKGTNGSYSNKGKIYFYLEEE